MIRCIALLQGLVDRSDPLPPPHPQRLSFPNDPQAIEHLARMTDALVSLAELDLSDLELRHLLFKVASACGRRGMVRQQALSDEMHEMRAPIERALRVHPGWLTSRAGVSWAERRFEQWQAESRKHALKTYDTPPYIDHLARRGYFLVELTNAAHVYAEGSVLGHCLAWSFNDDALRRRGYQSATEAFECLTFAIKLRSGELRLFSVRDPDGLAVMTIAYEPKTKWIVNVEGSQGNGQCDRKWLRFVCDAAFTLSKHVDVLRIHAPLECRAPCRRRQWCTQRASFIF